MSPSRPVTPCQRQYGTIGQKARYHMSFKAASVRMFLGLSSLGNCFLNLGSEVQVLSGTPINIKDLCQKRGQTTTFYTPSFTSASERTGRRQMFAVKLRLWTDQGNGGILEERGMTRAHCEENCRRQQNRDRSAENRTVAFDGALRGVGSV